MEYIYEIIVFFVLTFITFTILVTIKNKKNENKNEKILATLKHDAKIINNNNKLVNNLSLSDIQNNGGIISKKIIPGKTKEKIAKWVETNSYEDDVKLPVETIKKNEEEMKKIIIRSLILLVDDSLVVRKYVGDLLRKNNYDLVIKTDGWEAITYLNSNSQKPDLIITDIQMPNMDGFQLIEAIRREKKFNNVPIIVISAHVEANDHLNLMEEEKIQGFIRKPFEDSDLTVQSQYLLDNY